MTLNSEGKKALKSSLWCVVQQCYIKRTMKHLIIRRLNFSNPES